MSFCFSCKRKKCLKNGKPCKKVEKLLPKPTAGRNHYYTITDPSIIDKRFFLDWDGDISHFEAKKKVNYED